MLSVSRAEFVRRLDRKKARQLQISLSLPWNKLSLKNVSMSECMSQFLEWRKNASSPELLKVMDAVNRIDALDAEITEAQELLAAHDSQVDRRRRVRRLIAAADQLAGVEGERFYKEVASCFEEGNSEKN